MPRELRRLASRTRPCDAGARTLREADMGQRKEKRRHNRNAPGMRTKHVTPLTKSRPKRPIVGQQSIIGVRRSQRKAGQNPAKMKHRSDCKNPSLEKADDIHRSSALLDFALHNAGLLAGSLP